MRTQDRTDFQLEITEDAASGLTIRLHHNGRLPDPLAGFSPDILRKAKPIVWNNFERRILKKARTMSRSSYRFVRATLIAERAIQLEQAMRIKPKERTRFWALPSHLLQRLRDRRERRLASQTRVVSMMPQDSKTMSWSARLAAESGTALAKPRPFPQRQQSRGR